MATIGSATKDPKGTISFVRVRLFDSFELILGNRADRQPRLPPLGDGLGGPQLRHCRAGMGGLQRRLTACGFLAMMT